MVALWVVPGRALETARWKVYVHSTLSFGEHGEPGLGWAGRRLKETTVADRKIPSLLWSIQ